MGSLAFAKRSSSPYAAMLSEPLWDEATQLFKAESGRQESHSFRPYVTLHFAHMSHSILPTCVSPDD